MSEWGPAWRRRYRCRQRRFALDLDSGLSAPAWADAPWSEPLVHLASGRDAPAALATRFKMLWDPTCLYVGAWLAETNVAATVTSRDATILRDNTLELLIDPDSDEQNYLELQINALGTVWQLGLNKAYGQGGEADLHADIPGLRSGVHIDGVLNDPRHIDQAWSVALALPWSGLARYQRAGACPPKPGDRWRLNLARLQWVEATKKYLAWSPTGEINLHLPARWGDVVFD